MKFLFSATFLLLFSTAVCAQTALGFLPRKILEDQTSVLQSEWVTDSIYCYKKDNNSNNLIHDFRVYNGSLNDLGRVLIEVTQRHQNGQWINYQRQNNSYNNKGDLISNTVQFYDDEGSIWINAQKTDFTYNINGFLTKLEHYNFADNTWQRNYRNQYVYFNNVDPDEFTQQVFEGGFWRNKFKVYYSYDGAGKITSSLFTTWDNNQNDWVNNNRTFESYDQQERPIQVNREIWNFTNLSWVNSSRTNWIYNPSTGDTRIINEGWIVQDSTWLAANDVQIFYDNNKLETERIERNYDNGIYTNFFRSKKNYDDFQNLIEVDNNLFINGLWEPISFCEYFHTNTTSSTDPEIEQTKVLCKITNPINASTTISCSLLNENVRLRIMNAAGEIVYDQQKSGQFSVNKSFPNGSYFFIFSKENKLIETRKMIWKN